VYSAGVQKVQILQIDDHPMYAAPGWDIRDAGVQ
jgi:hypothetical protein